MEDLIGGCHCGNIRLDVRLSQVPEAMQVRADQCSFCRAHGVRSISDPQGLARISAARPGDISYYRFGLKTADFLICKTCGVYVAAVCDTPAGLRCVVNVNALKDRARFAAVPEPMDYDGEDVATRLARRGARWMPAKLMWSAK